MTYAAVAKRYASRVVGGKIPVCKWVKAACARHLADLKRSSSDDFPYHFDSEKAGKVCTFIELLPHIKGPKARQRIVLEPWQVFIVGSVFGWVRKDNGKRRFRKSYVEIPRGNAKSTLSAGIGLYGLALDGEAGAEIYSAATTRDQARIVFDVAQHMARKSPGYRKRFGVHVGSHSITQLSSASKFLPLSADADTLDGLNTHIAIVDEVHAHPTRKVYDVLETSLGKRDQSLLWGITTAGSNRAGICYEIRTYVTKILDGVFHDDSVFGIIYTIDDEDDWADPEIWPKANPNWGVSVMPEVVGQLATKAMQMPSAQNNFKSKHLDIWVNADVSWMDMRAWHRCGDPALTEHGFKGERCFGAVDLASKIDLAVAVKLFVKEIEKQRHYFCFMTSWLPEDAVTDSSNSQYSGWVRTGRIRVTSGNVIDFDEIERELDEWPSLYEVKGVGFDPFQATQFSTHMMAKGLPMVEVRPIVLNFSEPMKELDSLVRSGRFHHDGNPVLEWMISNVVAHYDKKDNIYPNKERPENKIDGPVAIIMALGRAMVDQGDGDSVYQRRGLIVI